MISPVAMAGAGLAFLFDVGNFAAGAYVAIAADDASAGERREAEKSNETHHVLRANAEQYICREISVARGQYRYANRRRSAD